MEATIESAEDLAKQTKIKYGVLEGGSSAAFFKVSEIDLSFNVTLILNHFKYRNQMSPFTNECTLPWNPRRQVSSRKAMTKAEIVF